MSHYTKVKTKIRSKDHLIKALMDMGFRKDQIQVHDVAKQLEGYESRLREQTAEIILRRHDVGGASNDIGFKLQADGTFEAIISDYDQHNHASNKNAYTKGTNGYGDAWLKRLNKRYARHKLVDELSERGFFIEKEEDREGQIFIECSNGFHE